MRRAASALVLVAGLVLESVPLFAQGDSPSQTRMQQMQQELALLTITSPDISASGLTFVTRPLLRYSDPTRGQTDANVLIDAGVWRLGEQGRPMALVTLEIYRAGARDGVLSYEFLSLSAQRFSMQHEAVNQIAWDSTESALMLKPWPDDVRPAMTSAARLLQARQFAKRFTVRERLSNETEVICRLLPQPIDRYAAPDAGLVDGALFAFANGTNPELGLVVECDREQWSYGLVRLSAAELLVAIDQREVQTFPHVDVLRRRTGSYVAHSQLIPPPE